MKQTLLTLAALTLAPTFAHAHTLPGEGGLASGFTHPWLGWDHLLVMLAVGFCAAQQFGREQWQVPLAFVSAMMAGGIVGAAGVSVPGVEFIVMLSIPVFGWIEVERVKARPGLIAELAAFFAFFHGLAHGTRVSPSAAANEEIHFRPVEPIQARFAITARF